MTTNTAPQERALNIVPFPRALRGSPAALTRLAFDLPPNLFVALSRVVALKAENPARPVRAADVTGDPPTPGYGERNVKEALAALTKRELLCWTRADGYVPAFDPSTYVQRSVQSAAGCTEATPKGLPCDPDEKPADPLVAVRAYEDAAKDSLRTRKWEAKQVHDFYCTRRDATPSEIRQAMIWVVQNWRTVLKRREFAALWDNEYDDDGFVTRRRAEPPALPEPKFIGAHAALLWKAWDAHQEAERVRAEEQRRREQEASERAERYAAQCARDDEKAHAAGLTLEEWLYAEERAAARERERKLAVQRANNPAMVRFMATSAARRECEAPDARAACAASFNTSVHVQRTQYAADSAPAWTPPDIVLPALPDFECPIRPFAHRLKPAPRPDPDPDFDFDDDPDFDGDLE